MSFSLRERPAGLDTTPPCIPSGWKWSLSISSCYKSWDKYETRSSLCQLPIFEATICKPHTCSCSGKMVYLTPREISVFPTLYSEFCKTKNFLIKTDGLMGLGLGSKEGSTTKPVSLPDACSWPIGQSHSVRLLWNGGEEDETGVFSKQPCAQLKVLLLGRHIGRT